LHPNIRIPLWAAVAIVAAAYIFRGISRGGDFSLDLPIDAILLGTLAVLLVIVALARRATATDDGEDSLTGEVQEEHDQSDGGGQEQDVLDEVE
jgi:hypothetical protein